MSILHHPLFTPYVVHLCLTTYKALDTLRCSPPYHQTLRTRLLRQASLPPAARGVACGVFSYVHTSSPSFHSTMPLRLLLARNSSLACPSVTTTLILDAPCNLESSQGLGLMAGVELGLPSEFGLCTMPEYMGSGLPNCFVEKLGLQAGLGKRQ